MNIIKKHYLITSLSLFTIMCLSSAFAIADATRVTSKALSEVAIYPELSVPASAVSMNDSKLSAEVRATVTVFPVLIGDIVERGEVLIQLNEKDYRLNLLLAKTVLKGIESRLTLATYQLNQAKTLSKENAISNELLQKRKSDVSTLKAEINTQKITIAKAKRDLKKCTIVAPFDAIVIERIVQVGELANPGSPLIRIVDASRIEVSAKFQAQDIKSLEKTNHFQFIAQDVSYDVALRKITPAYDPIQRSREARFLFKSKRALAGSTGTLRWKNSQAHIPANILIRRNRKLGVFIIDNGKARFIVIKGAHEGRPVATDLPQSTRLIINGRFSIQDGTSVTVD